MAPLYSRYVPPNSGAGAIQHGAAARPQLYNRYVPPSVKPNVAWPAATVGSVLQSSAGKKRKHERSDEEEAQRKEEKARKTGVHAPLPVDLESKDLVARGEFAHVKSAKKRHRLEKEARRARKAVAKADGRHDAQPGPGMSKADGTEEVEATEERPAENEAAPPMVQDGDAEVRKPKKRRKQEAEGHSLEQAHHESQRPEGRVKHVGQHEPFGKAEADEDARPKRADTPDEAVASQPKKRRHKLEAVLKQSLESSHAADAEDDKQLRKHGSILGKFQKSTKLAQAFQRVPKEPQSEPVVHEERISRIDQGLTPLPQPAKALTPDCLPGASALPLWLRSPTVISSGSKKTFAELGLEAKIVSHLAALGLQTALPVQQVLIPQLMSPGLPGSAFLPGTESVLPDLAVGAPTGSGKTIAYLLPIISALQRSPGLGKLRALIIVPTRELVQQVAAVAESLAKGSNVKVGTGTGGSGRNLADEAAKLITRGRRYDPEQYAAQMAKAHRQNHPPNEDDEDFEEFVAELEEQDNMSNRLLQDAVECLVDHVPTYSSAVEVLVATPGRLLEHVSSTLGFILTHVQYLVLDEGDKLLEQQYDGLLEKLNSELVRPLEQEEQHGRERLLRRRGLWDEQKERRVRKIVLSATMTRDVGRLAGLNLRRRKMVLVQGVEQGYQDVPGANEEDACVGVVGDEFELPPTLKEFCVPVRDGNEKPLYLLELLLKNMPLGQHGAIEVMTTEPGGSSHVDGIDSESDASDSASNSSSDISSDSSNSNSGSEQATSESASYKNEAEVAPDLHASTIYPGHLSRFSTATVPHRPTQIAAPPMILVFASSTESATRLSYLVGALAPQLASHILTLTKSKSADHAALHSPKEPIIAISTDRAARGLDTLAGRSITHVVQYDVPRSLTSYVHRAGRTSRAGRAGEAWTLYTDREARWFVNEVMRSDQVKRAQRVEKIKLSAAGEGERHKYKEVLEGMRAEVLGAPR